MNAIEDLEAYAERYQAALAGELRAEKGRNDLTLEQIALHTGMQIRTVSRYLNGERDIPATRLRAICDALDVNFVEVMRRVEERLEES